MVFLSQILFLVFLRVTQLWAFSKGPPSSRCESMYPRHRNSTVQSSPSPYSISVSNSSYTPGANLTVIISGSMTFKGFILQARGNDSSLAWPIGEFVEIPDGAKHLYCSGGEPKNTVGHYNPNGTDLFSLHVTWKAPPKSVGNVVFNATIVKDYYTYWVKVLSPVITGPPAENIARGAPTESFEINKTGCGETKGCYSLPPSCTGSADCNYLFTYRVSGGDVTIEMSAKERYVSVAFNEEKLMDKMDCILCATMATNLVELRHYYSHGHRMDRRSLADNSDVSLERIVFEDGGIKCRLSRKLTSNATYFKDLTEKKYILFAHGRTSFLGRGFNHRYENRTNTAETVDLSVAATLVSEQSQIKDTITKDGCGETKSCYSDPQSCKASSDCLYLLTFRSLKGEDGKSDSEEVEFEISAKSQWTSIGFNKNKKMPDSDIVICSVSHGKISVEHYVADQGYDRPTKTTPKPSSLVPTFTEWRGGVVSCRFKRKKKDAKMVDLNQPWYLIYTSGPMERHSIGKHTNDPKTSTGMVEIDKIGILAAEGRDSSKLKTHGAIMIIAWVGFASVGIFMARYMKMAFGDKELLGTKIWFTFHRSLMFLTFILTIVSTVVIFVDAGRWTDEAGAHPYTGIIVLVLAAIQPIMALYRPHPGEEKRYIFNWAHRIVGLSAFVMAVVSVFLGIRLEEAGLDDSALYAMIVYCVGVVLVIGFDVYLSLKRDNKASFSAVRKEVSTEDHPEDHLMLEAIANQSILARKLMLAFQVLLTSILVITLVVLIAAAGEKRAHDHHHHD